MSSAEESVRLGHAALNRFSLFGMGREAKVEEAIEHFTRGANNYKLSKAWASASQTYIRIADLHLELNKRYDAAAMLLEAANALKNTDIPGSVPVYMRAVDIYLNDGKLSNAARLIKDVGEIQEQLRDFPNALALFERAADTYIAEGRSQQRANQCLEKAATLAAQVGDYRKSSELFENLGREYLKERLLQLSARNFFVNSVLCILTTEDYIGARQKLSTYCSLDESIMSCRDGPFLDALIASCGSGRDGQTAVDINAFAVACENYDKISTLNAWRTSLLVATKRNLQRDSTQVAGGSNSQESSAEDDNPSENHEIDPT